MKKIIGIIVLALLAIGLYAATINVTVFNQKRLYVVQSARNDTSNVFSLNGSTNVELITSVYGTDSLKMLMKIQGKAGSNYVTLAYDTIWYGKNTTTTYAYAHGILLRGYGTNNIPGYEQVRIINTVTGYGSGDSISGKLASYTQSLIGR